jgi:putative transposase
MTKHVKTTAEQRMKLIAPLLSPGLDKALYLQMKGQISRETGLSERTLRRYLSQYQEQGFEGLKPATRAARQSDAIPEEILQEAILLRRQVPGRSVTQLIQILEWEGKIAKGQIKRSTLQEKLADRGYSSRQMKQYQQTGTASRRFVKPSRNCLWMSDVKYAIYLPIGEGKKPKQVYLTTWIDDCTRFILHSQFYSSLDKAIVIDSFRQALLKHGLPDAVYFDNGKEYRNKWMQDTTGLLGIKLMYARPYSPESKGKAEVFHQRVDSFLSEAKLEKVTTLDELNHLYQVWLDECYQHRPHSALTGNQSPAQTFRSDKRPIRYVDPKEIHEAFLHRQERRVDKTGCISFYGKPYDVGLRFLGMKVTVIFDPTDLSVITVQAKERVIGPWVGPRPTLPEHLTKAPADGSRLLNAALKNHEARDKPMLISYKEAGEPDV